MRSSSRIAAYRSRTSKFAREQSPRALLTHRACPPGKRRRARHRGHSRPPGPGWLFLVGGATVLVVSFVALGALWKKPKLEVGAGRPLPRGLQRFLLSPYLRVVVSGLSLAFFVVIWTAAAFGSERASANLAPTFIYIIFWVGMVVMTIVLGNVWSVLDPWRAAADAVAWCAGAVGWSREARPYPGWLGLWPAVVLLFSFVALELVYIGPVGAAHARARHRHLQRGDVDGHGDLRPRKVAGERRWARRLLRLHLTRGAVWQPPRSGGPYGADFRRPLSELARLEARPGAVAFIAVMLGSVAFDGLSRSSWWFERRYNLEIRFSDPESAERAVMLVNLSALVLAVVIVATIYTASVKIAEGVVGQRAAFRGKSS